MTMPLPASAVPPRAFHSPLLPDSPRKSVEFRSSVAWWNRSGAMCTTLPVWARRTSWRASSRALKVLVVTA
ncbi:hypothetical protein [Streptomyces sp. NPDC059783]|uniref:hypothetical protein n=1 Tax=Streptomyces sp. NPDC059783 TaxID=3346944 RepID=UPI003659FDC6